MTIDNNRYCIKCKQKDPPVDTVLQIGVNISQKRWDTSQFICDTCYRERQKEYRMGGKEKYAEYLRQKHDETVEELTVQWNDPAYKNLKEIADRVHKVWDKGARRTPDQGIRRDWICEVIFSDLWFIDANGIVEDFLKQSGKTKSAQICAKPYLLEFVVSRLELEQLPYREKAKHKWDGIVDTITKKYAGRDKMVATPAYVDPFTKESIDNWYLLSREKEREMREQTREAKIVRMETVTVEEKRLVERREGIERREKAKQEQQDEESNRGGENE
jgi:hypothetical protein